MKKILTIFILLISITLIGTGVYLSTTPEPKEENNQAEKEPEKGKVEYTDPNTPSKKFPSITTQDNKITLSNITVYYRDEVSAFEVEVTSKEDINELFLLIEFNLETKITERTIFLSNVKAKEKVKTQIQMGEDLTKAVSWSVKQLTKDEAEKKIKLNRSII